MCAIIYIYIYTYIHHTSRWYVRNYVRIVRQGWDNSNIFWGECTPFLDTLRSSQINFNPSFLVLVCIWLVDVLEFLGRCSIYLFTITLKDSVQSATKSWPP